MSETRSARDKVLDAFVDILVAEGDRAATMDAVAARAGVSKGGLLYHFASKEAMVEGILARLNEIARADAEHMRTAPEGAVLSWLAASSSASGEISRIYVAAARLGHEFAGLTARAIGAMEQQWLDVLSEAIGDPARARAILLLGDGMYAHAVNDIPQEQRVTLADVLPVVREMLAGTAADLDEQTETATARS